MTDHGANLWNVSNTQNHYFMHEYAESMRTTARETGVFREIASKLSLIYGASFGFKALNDPEQTENLRAVPGMAQLIARWEGEVVDVVAPKKDSGCCCASNATLRDLGTQMC